MTVWRKEWTGHWQYWPRLEFLNLYINNTFIDEYFQVVSTLNWYSRPQNFTDFQVGHNFMKHLLNIDPSILHKFLECKSAGASCSLYSVLMLRLHHPTGHRVQVPLVTAVPCHSTRHRPCFVCSSNEALSPAWCRIAAIKRSSLLWPCSSANCYKSSRDLIYPPTIPHNKHWPLITAARGQS